MGKAYANRKPIEERKESDRYETPLSLTKELINTGVLEGVKTILEPAAGYGAMAKVLREAGFEVTEKDIMHNQNFLLDEYEYGQYDAVVTNPPFSLYTEFVEKAKQVAPIVVMLSKVNFFGVQDRYDRGLWEHLKYAYIFTRQIDYQFPIQEDGSCGVGNLITGWFCWDMNYDGKSMIDFIDVQKYCKLGGYENWLKKNDSDKYQQLLDKKELRR